MAGVTKKILYNLIFTLVQALDQVLHNPKYAEAAKSVGSLMNDQITRPLDRAIWWMEHVMRHPKMYEGKSPVHRLSWYQYFLLDVIAFFVTILYVIFRIFKFLFMKCCSRKDKTKAD